MTKEEILDALLDDLRPLSRPHHADLSYRLTLDSLRANIKAAVGRAENELEKLRLGVVR